MTPDTASATGRTAASILSANVGATTGAIDGDCADAVEAASHNRLARNRRIGIDRLRAGDGAA